MPFDLASMRAVLTGPTVLALVLLWGTVLIAVAITYRQANTRLWHHLLPAGTLRHPSARTDLCFWIARRITKPLYLFPMALTAVGTGTAMHAALSATLPPLGRPPTGPFTLVLFTVSMLLAYDVSYYIYHYLQHKVPFMWELHKVHHSAEVMIGVTQGRVHPLDDFMTHLWDGMIPGLMYGIWLFFVLDPIELTVFGVNVYVLRNILMMDFVRHTHFKVSFGWLNNFVLCPHWHQLHHSTNPKHFDKNFGLMLSVWDRLFGTLMRPEPNETFNFGLADGEHLEYRGLHAVYMLPLVKIYRRVMPFSKTAS